jgi:hypothetical protein
MIANDVREGYTKGTTRKRCGTRDESKQANDGRKSKRGTSEPTTEQQRGRQDIVHERGQQATVHMKQL